MSYILTRYALSPDPDSKFPVAIFDNTINDTTTSLNILGKGVSNYAQAFSEDLVYLIENFAGPVPPKNQVTGQVWYDYVNQVLKVYNGTIWKGMNPSVTNGVPPTNPSIGDLWYNTATGTLSYWNGTMWVPITTMGTGAMPLMNNGNSYIDMEVNGQNVAIFSATNFTPNPVITGFPRVFGGLTFNTNSAFNGMSSGTLLPLATAIYNLGSPTQQWLNGYMGTLALTGTLNVIGPTTAAAVTPLTNLTYNLGGPSLQWLNGYFGNLIVSGSITGSLVPSVNAIYDLGSPSDQWNNLYAVNGFFSGNLVVDGTATFNGGITAQGDLLPAINDTYVVGNASKRWKGGDFSETLVVGSNATPSLSVTTSGGIHGGAWTLAAGASLEATYADLAEKYEADEEFSIGTLVSIGGPKDITRTQEDCSMEVFGVVSENAAFRMNGELGLGPTFPFVAHSGTIPVLVIGQVRKGQRLVASREPGYARAISDSHLLRLGSRGAFIVIGRALMDKHTETPELLKRVAVNIVM